MTMPLLLLNCRVRNMTSVLTTHFCPCGVAALKNCSVRPKGLLGKETKLLRSRLWLVAILIPVGGALIAPRCALIARW